SIGQRFQTVALPLSVAGRLLPSGLLFTIREVARRPGCWDATQSDAPTGVPAPPARPPPMWPWSRRAAASTRKKLTAFVDEGSQIEGKYTFTGTLVVNGKLVGNVYASERVELSGKARVLGDVQAPIVVLEEGVMFEGHCKMPRPGTVDATGESVVAALEHS